MIVICILFDDYDELLDLLFTSILQSLFFKSLCLGCCSGFGQISWGLLRTKSIVSLSKACRGTRCRLWSGRNCSFIVGYVIVLSYHFSQGMVLYRCLSLILSLFHSFFHSCFHKVHRLYSLTLDEYWRFYVRMWNATWTTLSLMNDSIHTRSMRSIGERLKLSSNANRQWVITLFVCLFVLCRFVCNSTSFLRSNLGSRCSVRDEARATVASYGLQTVWQSNDVSDGVRRSWAGGGRRVLALCGLLLSLGKGLLHDTPSKKEKSAHSFAGSVLDGHRFHSICFIRSTKMKRSSCYDYGGAKPPRNQ
jgi:hypothetical protein